MIFHIIVAVIATAAIIFSFVVGKPDNEFDFVSPIGGIAIILLAALAISLLYNVKGCVS